MVSTITKSFTLRSAIIALVIAIGLPVFAQADPPQGRGRGQEKKYEKFKNGHDARDGRWGRGYNDNWYGDDEREWEKREQERRREREKYERERELERDKYERERERDEDGYYRRDRRDNGGYRRGRGRIGDIFGEIFRRRY